MNDRTFYLSLGFLIGMFLSNLVMVYMPPQEPDFICGGCGSPYWYSQIADGEDF